MSSYETVSEKFFILPINNDFTLPSKRTSNKRQVTIEKTKNIADLKQNHCDYVRSRGNSDEIKINEIRIYLGIEKNGKLNNEEELIDTISIKNAIEKAKSIPNSTNRLHQSLKATNHVLLYYTIDGSKKPIFVSYTNSYNMRTENINEKVTISIVRCEDGKIFKEEKLSILKTKNKVKNAVEMIRRKYKYARIDKIFFENKNENDVLEPLMHYKVLITKAENNLMKAINQASINQQPQLPPRPPSAPLPLPYQNIDTPIKAKKPILPPNDPNNPNLKNAIFVPNAPNMHGDMPIPAPKGNMKRAQSSPNNPQFNVEDIIPKAKYCIKSPDDEEPIYLDLDPNTLVGQLREQLAELLDLLEENITLFFAGKTLRNEQSLKSLHIPKTGKIIMFIRSIEDILLETAAALKLPVVLKILIKDLKTGNENEFLFEKDDTISNAKVAIANKYGIDSLSNINIFYNGFILLDNNLHLEQTGYDFDKHEIMLFSETAPIVNIYLATPDEEITDDDDDELYGLMPISKTKYFNQLRTKYRNELANTHKERLLCIYLQCAENEELLLKNADRAIIQK